MKNYYYLFWSDAIQRFNRHHSKERGLEKKLLILNSWVFTLAVLSTMLWLKYFHVYQSKFGVFGIFTTFGKKTPFLLEMVVVFLLIYIINYVLIFWRNRYLLLIEKYALGRFNYSVVVSLSLLAYFLFTIFLYGYLTSQM
ncbi:MAG TPA: hypothetical protein VHE59_07635 [Mucilaginibacter sp.]|nr:hypothetical protein [Mucilaginibacter sp.]